jgi:hypothetical protein
MPGASGIPRCEWDTPVRESSTAVGGSPERPPEVRATGVNDSRRPGPCESFTPVTRVAYPGAQVVRRR